MIELIETIKPGNFSIPIMNQPINISNNDAFTDLTNALTGGIDKLVNTGNLVGVAIAGLISVACGIAVLFILIMALWDTWKNSGGNNVIGEHGGKLAILLAITAISGLIAAAFFVAG